MTAWLVTIAADVSVESVKTHKRVVPYDELPAAQKAKDALFVGVVNALRARVL